MGEWQRVCKTEDVLENGGSCVKVEGQHIAIFNFDNRSVWYAVDNVCPHNNQSVLSRGLIGESNGEPKVACPLHKTTYSLKTGQHLADPSAPGIQTFPIKVEDDEIFIKVEK